MMIIDFLCWHLATFRLKYLVTLAKMQKTAKTHSLQTAFKLALIKASTGFILLHGQQYILCNVKIVRIVYFCMDNILDYGATEVRARLVVLYQFHSPIKLFPVSL